MQIINGYIYIPVSDFDQAAEWYSNMLDFTTVFKDKLYYELRTKSGVRVMLIERRGGINSQMMYDTGAQATYGFAVSDINSAHSELKSKGAEVGEIGDYQGKSFSFSDLDGNILELWQES